jgi:hypothetical protein
MTKDEAVKKTEVENEKNLKTTQVTLLGRSSGLQR